MLLPPRSRGRPPKTERPQRFIQREQHPINHHVAGREPTQAADRDKPGRPRAPTEHQRPQPSRGGLTRTPCTDKHQKPRQHPAHDQREVAHRQELTTAACYVLSGVWYQGSTWGEGGAPALYAQLAYTRVMAETKTQRVHLRVAASDDGAVSQRGSGDAGVVVGVLGGEWSRACRARPSRPHPVHAVSRSVAHVDGRAGPPGLRDPCGC